MSRTKPIPKLEVIGTFDLRPEHGVGTFATSKAQDEFYVKPSNWDSAGDSIELLHVQHAREHEAMLKSQQIMLVENERMANLNKHRTAKLYQTQAHLRQRFIEANSFIKEISEKADKDKKCAEKELALHEELRSGIEKFKKSIDELTDFRVKFKQTAEEYETYERVTEAVVEKSHLFDSPKDCMNRCDALMLAQVDIRKLVEHKIKEIDAMRQKMALLSMEAASKMLGLKTELTEMERDRIKAHEQCSKWERILNKAKYWLGQNELDKQRTRESVQILYRIFSNHKGIIQNIALDVEKQLDFVKDEIEILSAVANRYKRSSKADDRVTEHKC